MEEQLQKIIELVEKSEYVSVFLPPNARLDHLAAAEVLVSLLEERGKQVGFLSKPEPERALAPDYFKRIFSIKAPPKEFVVSIKTTESPVSQLRYEKQPDGVDIILSPKSSPLDSQMVSFREGKVLCDLAILLGIGDADNFTGADCLNPEFFTETPLINVDFSEKNKKYGEVNLVDENCSSLSEIIYDLAAAFREEPLSGEQATMLLTGILNQTEKFRSPKTNADTLMSSSELLRLGASREKAFELNQQATPLSLLQLFGRAAIRSKTNEDEQIVWSFLIPEDFSKTSRTGEDAPEVLRHLKDTLPPRKFLILLWQEPGENSVQAVVSASLNNLLMLENKENGEIKNGLFFSQTTSPTFKEAEERLGALLKDLV